MSETGKEARKKMKTESGGWISSSYKSNAYREWMEQHKMEAVLAGEEEEEAEGRGGGKRGRCTAIELRFGLLHHTTEEDHSSPQSQI